MKSYTDLEQSKRLAEILPIESADMCFNISQRNNMPPLMTPYSKFNEFFNMETPNFLIPCWSLAALLGVLPKEINVLGITYSINIHTKSEKWFIDYKCNNEEFVGVYSNIFIDACYEMILKLNKLKML